MNKNDYPEFCEIWQMAQELSANSKVYSPAAMTEIFEMLESYRLDEIRQALRQHRMVNKFAPVLHDVLDALNPKPSRLHLPADEAWAIALLSMDESETVVVTDEILRARSAAWDIFADGDKIGARMAFRAAYEREVQSATMPPVWKASLGHDKQRREETITKAVNQGLLPSSTLKKLGIIKDEISFKNLESMAKTKAVGEA